MQFEYSFYWMSSRDLFNINTQKNGSFNISHCTGQAQSYAVSALVSCGFEPRVCLKCTVRTKYTAEATAHLVLKGKHYRSAPYQQKWEKKCPDFLSFIGEKRTQHEGKLAEKNNGEKKYQIIVKSAVVLCEDMAHIWAQSKAVHRRRSHCYFHCKEFDSCLVKLNMVTLFIFIVSQYPHCKPLNFTM